MLLRRRHVSQPSGVLVPMHPFAYFDGMFLAAWYYPWVASQQRFLIWYVVITVPSAHSKQPALNNSVLCRRAKLQHGQCAATPTALRL
jgi:hypothetical protein